LITVGVLKAARMRERKRPAHRPSFGVHETRFILSAPKALVEAMKTKAEKEGIAAAEAWRRAAREYLGLKPDEYTKYLEAKEDE